jgi:hypothetical protein
MGSHAQGEADHLITMLAFGKEIKKVPVLTISSTASSSSVASVCLPNSP